MSAGGDASNVPTANVVGCIVVVVGVAVEVLGCSLG